MKRVRELPSPRYFVVPIEVAEDLADALDTAAYGELWSEPPEWWDAFEEQYEKREWEADEPQRDDTERDRTTELSEPRAPSEPCAASADGLSEPPIVDDPIDLGRAIRAFEDIPLEFVRLQAQCDTFVDRLSHVHHEVAVLLGERELCAAGVGG